MKKLLTSILMVLAISTNAFAGELIDWDRSCRIYRVEYKKYFGVMSKHLYNASFNTDKLTCKCNRNEECVEFYTEQKYVIMIEYAKVYNDKRGDYEYPNLNRYGNGYMPIFNKRGFQIAALIWKAYTAHAECAGASKYSGEQVLDVKVCDVIRN